VTHALSGPSLPGRSLFRRLTGTRPPRPTRGAWLLLDQREDEPEQAPVAGRGSGSRTELPSVATAPKRNQPRTVEKHDGAHCDEGPSDRRRGERDRDAEDDEQRSDGSESDQYGQGWISAAHPDETIGWRPRDTTDRLGPAGGRFGAERSAASYARDRALTSGSAPLTCRGGSYTDVSASATRQQAADCSVSIIAAALPAGRAVATGRQTMYAVYIAHRTQIYLDDHQDRLLGERSRQVGRTKSALIREAIDEYLAPSSSDESALARLRAAVAQASGAAPYLPSGADYVQELRALELERQRSHERR